MNTLYKAIIFDLDGVLTDTEPIHVEAMTHSFADYGYVLNDADIEKIIARHPSEYVPELFSEHGWDEQHAAEIIDTFKKYYHKLWDNKVQLNAGAKKLFDILKSKEIICCLATNSGMSLVQKLISKFELDGIFGQLTTADEITKKKPDPQIYLIAKNKLNLADEHILAIEDSGVGLKSAMAAGLATAVIPTSMTKNQDFTGAQYNLKSLLDIADLVK